MAATAERQMNLAALQQRDPYITTIVDTASQVALYSFSSKANEWEKTEIEGTLFVYTRSASPINGVMILNRLGLNDLIEPLNKNLEFQLQDPFLLYRNEKASIYGIWFYDKDECARIGQLMNSLVQVAVETHEEKNAAAGRQRRASESDTMFERGGGGNCSSEASAAMATIAINPAHNVDIMQMLSKAQDEYDKNAAHGVSQNGAIKRPIEPKPLIDNPNASATKSTDLLRPRPLKVPQEQGASSEEVLPVGGATGGSVNAAGACGAAATAALPAAATEPTTPTSNTPISLETLFRKASLQHEATKIKQIRPSSSSKEHQPLKHQNQQPQQAAHPPSAASPSSAMPTLLQRLMSNPGATVEEIERQQRGDIPRDQMPKPAGAEATPGVANGSVASTATTKASVVFGLGPGPESPNSLLKRTLNIPFQKDTSVSLVGSARVTQVFSRTETAPALLASRHSEQAPRAQPVISSRPANSLHRCTSLISSSANNMAVVGSWGPSAATYTSPSVAHPAGRSPAAERLGTVGGNTSTGILPASAPASCVAFVPSLVSLPSAQHSLQERSTDSSSHISYPGASQPPLHTAMASHLQMSTGSSGSSLSLAPRPHGAPGSKFGSGEELITPQALLQTATASLPATLSSQGSASQSVLLTPMVFQTPSRGTPPLAAASLPLQQSASDSGSLKSSSPCDQPSDSLQSCTSLLHPRSPTADGVHFNPLTREQLQQALVYLLKNDSSFLSSIHEAYVKSLQEGLSSSTRPMDRL